MNVIFAGFGVVGRSVARLLLKRMRELRLRGVDLKTVAIIDSGGTAFCESGISLDEAVQMKEEGRGVSEMKPNGVPGMTVKEALEKVRADLLIETTPTNVRDGEPGYSHITTALNKGIDVITTNKGPIALSLPQLKNIAEKNGSRLKYSGTVGGGIPILEFAKYHLNNEVILSARGVLNATTNYVLWRMAVNHVGLKEALAEARGRGIAERDARYDVMGLDTACKLVIIANSTMDFTARLEDVEVEGIQNVSLNDVLEAEKKGMAVRLVGRIEDQLVVSPLKVKKTDPIYVEGDGNSFSFTTEYNHYTLIGRGAGGVETANAVIRDLLNIIRTDMVEGGRQPLS